MSVSLYRMEMDKRKGMIETIIRDSRLELDGMELDYHWIPRVDGPRDFHVHTLPPMTETPIRFIRFGNRSEIVRVS